VPEKQSPAAVARGPIVLSDLIAGIWATESEKKVAAEVVARLSSGLAEISDSYEASCEPFIHGKFDGKWWWFDSKVFGRRFLMTDVFGQLRDRQGFDAMAVSWRRIEGKGSPEFWTPPSIQVAVGNSFRSDVFEHEAIHVAQILVDHEFPGKPKVPFPGPFPPFSERILKEFEANLVQSVYFLKAYEGRVVLDFNCAESAQLSALRSAFFFVLKQCVMGSAYPERPDSLSYFHDQYVAPLAINLFKFGESLTDTFRGTVLDSSGVVPTLDQLAMHLFSQVREHTQNLSEHDPRLISILRALVPIFKKWSPYVSDAPFEILHRFRPPNPPPNLNRKVIDE
jgi:hypothetical protein